MIVIKAALLSLMISGDNPVIENIADIRSAESHGLEITPLSYSPTFIHPEKQCHYRFKLTFALEEVARRKKARTVSISLLDKENALQVWSEEIDAISWSKTYSLSDKDKYQLSMIITTGDAQDHHRIFDLSSIVREAFAAEQKSMCSYSEP